MKQQIYIDTSVVGGYFDEEFKEVTQQFFQRLEKGEIIFVVSDLLDIELINAQKRLAEYVGLRRHRRIVQRRQREGRRTAQRC